MRTRNLLWLTWLGLSPLIACLPAQAMQVDLSANIQGERSPTIRGATNLPDGMKLLVRVTRKESAFRSETPVEVQSGHFEVAKRVKDWLHEHAERIEMFFLPGYAPDLNPDELLIKRAVGQARARDCDAMKAATRKWLHRRQKQPAILANFFDEPHVRYARA